MFETQRSAIKQGQQATKQAIEFQRSANRMALNGMRSQESTQRQGVELLKAGTRSYLDAVDTMLPGAGAGTGQLRGNADELFSQLERSHAELFETLTAEAERGVNSYEELTAEYLAALDEQLDALLDAHEDVQSQTVEVVDGYEARSETIQDRFEEAMDEQIDRAEEFQARLEEHFETQVEQAEWFQQQLEAQAEQFQDQLDKQAKEAQESAETCLATIRSVMS